MITVEKELTQLEKDAEEIIYNEKKTDELIRKMIKKWLEIVKK